MFREGGDGVDRVTTQSAGGATERDPLLHFSIPTSRAQARRKKKKRLRGLYSQRRRPRTQHKQKQYLSREHQCFLSASRLGDAETKAAQPAWCCVELAKTAASPQPRGPTTKALPPKSNEAARHSSSLRSRIHQVHISCISSSPSVTQAYHNRDRDIPAFYGCCGGKTR
jgi:hypothetical protein